MNPDEIEIQKQIEAQIEAEIEQQILSQIEQQASSPLSLSPRINTEQAVIPGRQQAILKQQQGRNAIHKANRDKLRNVGSTLATEGPPLVVGGTLGTLAFAGTRSPNIAAGAYTAGDVLTRKLISLMKGEDVPDDEQVYGQVADTFNQNLPMMALGGVPSSKPKLTDLERNLGEEITTPSSALGIKESGYRTAGSRVNNPQILEELQGTKLEAPTFVENAASLQPKIDEVKTLKDTLVSKLDIEIAKHNDLASQQLDVPKLSSIKVEDPNLVDEMSKIASDMAQNPKASFEDAQFAQSIQSVIPQLIQGQNISQTLETIKLIDTNISSLGGYNARMPSPAKEVLIKKLRESRALLQSQIDNTVEQLKGVSQNPEIKGLPSSVVNDLSFKQHSFISLKEGLEEAAVQKNDDLSRYVRSSDSYAETPGLGERVTGAVSNASRLNVGGTINSLLGNNSSTARIAGKRANLVNREPDAITIMNRLLGGNPPKVSLPRNAEELATEFFKYKPMLISTLAQNLVMQAGLPYEEAVKSSNDQLIAIEQDLKNPARRGEVARTLMQIVPQAFETEPSGYSSLINDGQGKIFTDPMEQDHFSRSIKNAPLEQRIRAKEGLINGGRYVPINPTQNAQPQPNMATSPDYMQRAMQATIEPEFSVQSRTTETEDMLSHMYRAMNMVDASRSGDKY